jgi:nucleoside-diphosphate-sugar epimerase
MTMLPRLVVTGASGLVGRHLLAALAPHHRIVGIARRSQARSGAPVHPNIEWHQVDVADGEAVDKVFAHVRATGGAEYVLHLAAHYDFTGEEHEEYWRTNVTGLRNVLEACRTLRPRRFFFSSSLAACRLPAPGATLTETSPPDGEHVYARSKAAGERMLAEYAADVPSNTLRFAALFTDWCEYAPLYVFLETWLSRLWNRSLLGGRGRSAIPYLHVDDLVQFSFALLRRVGSIEPGQVLLVSPDVEVSHAELFAAATRESYGASRRPWHVPRVLCGPGMWARDLAGRVLGDRPFERPWMARYVDEVMAVDARRTRELLGWAPRPRLLLLRRLHFLLENRKVEPEEWHARNRAAFKHVELRPYLRVYRLLERHEGAIADALTDFLLGDASASQFPAYRRLSAEDHAWNHRLILRHLMNAVRTRERAVFVNYCRDLAERRHAQGFAAREVCDVLRQLNRLTFKVLCRDREWPELRPFVIDYVTGTLRYGCDQAEDAFETLGQRLPEEPGSAA